MALCKCCNNKITDENQIIICCVCKGTFNSKCVDISSVETRILRSKSNIKWNCSACSKFEADVQFLKSTVITLLDEIKDLKNSIKNMSPNLTVNTSCTETERLIVEINERQKRSRNIILYNVPEPDNNTADDNRKDFEFVNVLLTTICNEPIIPSRIIRLGQKTSVNARPIKLILQDEKFATIIMRNSKKLKSHDTYKNIYLRHDLTFQQREYSAVIKKEFVRRKASGESDIVLKYIRGIPKIIKPKNVQIPSR